MLILGTVAVGAVIGGAVGGTVAYKSAEESGETGSDLFWSTAKGVGKGAAIGGVAGGLVAAAGGVAATYGAGSIVGTAMISGTTTIAAKATEVTALQINRSTNEGKSNWKTANNVVDSLFNNGGKVVGLTPFTKSAGVVGGYELANTKYSFTNEYAKVTGRRLSFAKHLASSATTGGKVFAYGIAAYAWGNTVYSSFSKNPEERAKRRGYTLK